MPNQGSSRRGFKVAASPFNPLKLMLGIILLFGLLLLVFCSLLGLTNGIQLLILGAYAGSAAVFIIFKAKRIVHGVSNKPVER